MIGGQEGEERRDDFFQKKLFGGRVRDGEGVGRARTRWTTPGSPGPPFMVCDFPAPLWPYASTAPLIPARTSSSVGRTASNTASLEAVGGKTASKENEGEPASVTSAPRVSTHEPRSDVASGRTRHTTRVLPLGARSVSAGDMSRGSASRRARLKCVRAKRGARRAEIGSGTLRFVKRATTPSKPRALDSTRWRTRSRRPPLSASPPRSRLLAPPAPPPAAAW